MSHRIHTRLRKLEAAREHERQLDEAIVRELVRICANGGDPERVTQADVDALAAQVEAELKTQWPESWGQP